MSQGDRFLDSHVCVSQGTCPPDSIRLTRFLIIVYNYAE